MIWIRADGGREIGMGHIMRCLSVAVALRKMGEQVCFLVADDSPVPFLEEMGIPYQVLHSDYRQMGTELDGLRLIPGASGSRREAGVFLADSYFVTAEYLDCVGKCMPVAYMDDMERTDLPVDLLINYNIFAEESLYRNSQMTGSPIFLTGTRYAPLRQEFGQICYKVRAQAQKVLITTGGSDRYNLAGAILDKALENSDTADLEYCVVSGAFNQNSVYLEKLEKTNGNVHIYKNVSKMAKLMEQCDIAVTAGGSTMYELSAVGVPMISFSFVDNQEKIVRGFKERDVICYGGNYLQQGSGMIDEIVGHIGLLRESTELRADYSWKQRRLVDGRGAERIAVKLIELSRGYE